MTKSNKALTKKEASRYNVIKNVSETLKARKQIKLRRKLEDIRERWDYA